MLICLLTFQRSHVALCHTHTPRINFDEVQLQRVFARRQHEGLCYVGPFALDIITATYLVIPANSDSSTVPTLEIVSILEVTFAYESQKLCGN